MVRELVIVYSIKLKKFVDNKCNFKLNYFSLKFNDQKLEKITKKNCIDKKMLFNIGPSISTITQGSIALYNILQRLGS